MSTRLTLLTLAAPLLAGLMTSPGHANGDARLTPALAAARAAHRRSEGEASRQRAIAAAERARAAGGLDDPMVMTTVDHLPFDLMGVDASLMVEQPIPLSGVRSARRAVAAGRAREAEAEAHRVRLELAAEAAGAVVMLWMERRLDAELADQEAVASRVQTAAAARHSAARAEVSEVLRAETALIELTTRRDALAGRLRAAEIMLAAALGADPLTPPGEVALDDLESELPTAEESVRLAWASRPELRAMDAEIASARAEVRVMEAMGAPMAVVRVGAASTMSEGPGLMLGVGVSLPIWRERVAAGVDEARAMLRMAEADRSAMATMIAAEALAAREQVLASRARLLRLEETLLPKARLALETTLAGYGAGLASLSAVLEALSALQSAERTTSMAIADVARGHIHFARALGRLPGELP